MRITLRTDYTMQLNKGTELQNGKYRILGILGQGGFGITYLAQQERPNRKVAIKEFFMKEHCNRDGDSHNVSVPSVGSRELVKHFRHKFLKEADLIASFDNSNIIRIHDVFEENGTAYYVMEYLEGKSLKAIVDEQGALPEDVAVEYIRQVCNALKEVHENNLLHLDIKPANIMLGKKGNAVLIDFGISKHYDEAGVQTSSTGAGISEGYAPLEQYETGALKTFTPVTDIYAVGATLFFLLTGTRPPKASEVMNHGLPALPGNVSPAVRKAIETAMQPVTANRPQSVEEFLKLVESGEMKDESEETEVVVKKGDNDETVGDWEKETSNENDTDLTDLSGAAKVLNKNNAVPKKKKSSKGLWIIILLAVICGAVGGFMLLGGGNAVKKDSVKDTAMTVAEKSDTANKDSVSAAVIPDVIKDTSEIIAQTEPLEAFVIKEDKNADKKAEPQEAFIIKEDKNADKKADDKSDDKSAEMSAGEACSKGNAAYNKMEFNAAAKLYLFAAEKGHADAQYMLARCYMTGRGIPESEKDMVKWMTKAAEQCHAKAQNELGLCYKLGKGVEKSDSVAAKWFRKAAQQGNAEGQCNLGKCYEDGEGVEKSLETASEWYKRAAEQGYEEAKKYLNDIQSSSVTGTINGHEYVDLGLPSGLKWATCNVGASKPEEYGNYYAWGETETKEEYTDKNSKTYKKRRMGNISGNPLYDAAIRNWGGSWRLPTKDDFEELREYCEWRWIIINGVGGCEVKSKKNGNSIFLPAAGWQDGDWNHTLLTSVGISGLYWSSTPYESASYSAYFLDFKKGGYDNGIMTYKKRSYGLSVRPVSE